jgi:hypothetical protein
MTGQIPRMLRCRHQAPHFTQTAKTKVSVAFCMLCFKVRRACIEDRGTAHGPLDSSGIGRMPAGSRLGAMGRALA